jgi:hemerythrin-like metal-binding protein
MAFIEWKSEFSVGHLDLDHDHRRLSEIINRLYDAVELEQGNTVIGAILSSLRRYVETHFAREERLLTLCGVSDAVAHVQSHRRIEATLEDFENLHRCSPLELDSRALLAFLRKWLIGHVLKDDMRYRCFFQQLSQAGESAEKKVINRALGS